MDEEFHKTDKLSKEKMRQLVQRSNHPATIRFIVMYLLLLGTASAVVLTWHRSWWELTLAFLGFGIIGCSLFACQHETVHNTAFRSRAMNRIAAFLCGIGHMYAPSSFRELHFTHHRYTHVPGKDPEISLGNQPMPSVVGKLPFYLGWLSGLPLVIFKTLMLVVGAFGMPEFIRKRLFPFVSQKARLRIAIESLFILMVHAGIVVLALLVHPGFWGLLIGQVVAHCLLASYLIMEHNGLPYEGNILEKTRSMNTSRLVKLLMWNMPYHAEHHAYPGIPFHALPKLHHEISDEIIHKELDHPHFHWHVLQGKF